jgi:hypothetical protein
VGLADRLRGGAVAVGVAVVGTGVGSGGSGIDEDGDGVADPEGEDEVDDPDGVGSATDDEGLGVAEGLWEALGVPDVEPGFGVTSARAGSASARQTAAVSAATAPRRTTV